jgi:hypothetical protein
MYVLLGMCINPDKLPVVHGDASDFDLNWRWASNRPFCGAPLLAIGFAFVRLTMDPGRGSP